MRVVILCAACTDTSDSSEGYCPSWLPRPVIGPPLTVTEGGSTSFVLATAPFDQTEAVSVMIATGNTTIATMTPRGFVVFHQTAQSPVLEIFGVDDGAAAGDRHTALVAAFDDCGGGDPGGWGTIVVVDRQSPSVIASEWDLVGPLDAFDVTLTQPPASPVTVMVTASAGLTATPASLVFDSTSYGIAQSVHVAGSASGQIQLDPDGGLATRTVLVSR